jgi:hypothetical protein
VKVLVLADNMIVALRVLDEVRKVPGVEAHALLCNNARLPRWKFFLQHWLVIARRFFRRAGEIAALRRAGRLHLVGAPLHDERVLEWIRRERFDVGLHDMGVIYRQPAISAFTRGILNAHIGILPEYRGRSVMEWSLLAGAPTGVTVFFIDTGIDTGREIVLQREVPVGGRDIQSAKDGLFARDGEMYRLALERLLAPGFVPGTNEGGRRYYVMSGLLRGVVAQLLG